MTAQAAMTNRRFVRNGDKALFAGVCAGIADYFGFNLRVTRLLVIIALFAAPPITLATYFAIVFLVPAEPGGRACCGGLRGRRRRRRMSRREKRESAEEERRRASEAVSERARSLDERLARIEKYVTSSRYDLDREFRNL